MRKVLSPMTKTSKGREVFQARKYGRAIFVVACSPAGLAGHPTVPGVCSSAEQASADWPRSAKPAARPSGAEFLTRYQGPGDSRGDA